MIVGFHFTFSAYGFWLPNDPRGSWSTVIRHFDLLRSRYATKVQTTRSVAAKAHDEQRRLAAKPALKHSPVQFSGEQASAITRGFAAAVAEHHYAIHALAILPDHVHLVMRKHPRHIDQIAAHLKAKATRQLTQENLHPFADAPRKNGTLSSPWARKHWCPFIDSEAYMARAIRYVNGNPIKAGFAPQRWNLVTPYVP